MRLLLDLNHYRPGDVLISSLVTPKSSFLTWLGFYRKTFTYINHLPLRYIGGGYMYEDCDVKTKSCLWWDWLSLETNGSWLYK